MARNVRPRLCVACAASFNSSCSRNHTNMSRVHPAAASCAFTCFSHQPSTKHQASSPQFSNCEAVEPRVAMRLRWRTRVEARDVILGDQFRRDREFQLCVVRPLRLTSGWTDRTTVRTVRSE